MSGDAVSSSAAWPPTTFAQVGASADAFGYSSSSPVVTSSGTTSGTGILWVNWADGPGSTTAQLRAYNPIPDAQGHLDLLWSAPSGASVKLSEPGVAGNRVYVGSGDGRLYVLDLASGKKLWEFEAGSPLSASPAIAEGRLVIGSQDGRIFCFGEATANASR